jgi:hypothetical protein
MDVHITAAKFELHFLYVGDVRTLKETHLMTSTSCYGYNFNFLICR